MIEPLLYILWIVLSGVFAIKIKNAIRLYLTCATMAIVPIWYSQRLHGLAETGGIFQAAVAGLYPVCIYYIAKLIRTKTKCDKQ